MKNYVIFFNVICLFLLINRIGCDSNDDDDDETIQAWEHLWVGDDITERYKIKVEAPKNSTLFQFMEIAAEEDSDFEFEYIDFSTGHNKFITSIGGHSQDPSINLYWLVFILDKPPKKNSPPGKDDLSPLAAGNLIVQNKKHYLWWLRTANLWD